MSGSETAISNRREELPRVVDAVMRFASEHNLSGDVTKDLQVVLDEILANIIEYAYADQEDHQILIRLRMNGAILEMTVEDDGMAFNPLDSRVPDLGAPLHKRRVGGLGIHFVKQLMSDVTYDRTDGRNRLMLKKKLPG